MSSSASEQYHTESGSDSPSQNEADFPESPRKRRRISPSASDDDGEDQLNDRKAALLKPPTPASNPVQVQSRIKARINGPRKVTAAAVKEIDHEKINGILKPVSKSTFTDIGVDSWLAQSLANMAISRPTSIQRNCIPEILKGRDCIGGSRTGSGKTVAFAVPILQKWAQDPVGIFAVVLTPTRELALQIFEQFQAIAAPQSLKPVLITGGADIRAQALALSQRPHLVIATPGRLADHVLNSGEDTICGLRRVRFVVLDEADRLLAEGKGSMLPDVETCLGVLPPSSERQTLLFTATVTPEVRALKEMPRPRNKPPVYVCEVGDTSATTTSNAIFKSIDDDNDSSGFGSKAADPNTTPKTAIPSTLAQNYILVPVTHREAYLHTLLSTPANSDPSCSVIIFTNRTATANYLEHVLRLLTHRVTALHSGLPQYERTSNLARFRASAARILVATDVAARGLDIPTVNLVINYDLPRDPDDYVHRVGRTARAGRKGTSVSFVGQRDVELVKAIEERVGREMIEYIEEDVSIEGRVVREGLRAVGPAKREALLRIEEGRDVKGNRKRGVMESRKGRGKKQE